MIKTFLFFLLFSLLHHCSFAQPPTQAEMDKMMKKAQLEIEKMKKDPKNKELIKSMPNMDSIMNLMNNGKQPVNISAINNSIKADSIATITKNHKLLSQLPKKPLADNELAIYVNTLHTQLLQKIKSSSADSARITAGQIGDDGESLTGAAIIAWYKNDAEASVLLAMQAATLSLNDNTSLNNCAAILSMAGLENKAIPILQVLLKREPTSSTVLNNLGQAYAGLGEMDTAMYYFGRCIKIAPEHPEANNTATIICIKRGQMEAARKYCLQSLKGGLTGDAIQSFGRLFPGKDYNDVDEGPYRSYPFNEHDFTFPEQCETIENAVAIKAELDALQAMYIALHDKMKKGIIGENYDKMQRMAEEFGKHPLANMDMAESGTVFTRRANYALSKIIIPLSQEREDLILKHGAAINKLETEVGAKRAELNKNHSAELSACDQDNLCYVKTQAKYCRLFNELSNKYLPIFAVINRDFVKKSWRLHKEMFEAMSVWHRIAIKPGTMLKAGYEAVRLDFILSPLINGTILHDGYQVYYRDVYCNGKNDEETKKIEELEIKEDRTCNFNISIPLGKSFRMRFTCDEYELEGGMGVRAKFNKNFRTGQTTLYAGVGAAIPGFKTHGTAYAWVCFDRNNQPVDGGTLLEGSVVGMKSELRTSVITGKTTGDGALKYLADTLPYLIK